MPSVVRSYVWPEQNKRYVTVDRGDGSPLVTVFGPMNMTNKEAVAKCPAAEVPVPEIALVKRISDADLLQEIKDRKLSVRVREEAA